MLKKLIITLFLTPFLCFSQSYTDFSIISVDYIDYEPGILLKLRIKNQNIQQDTLSGGLFWFNSGENQCFTGLSNYLPFVNDESFQPFEEKEVMVSRCIDFPVGNCQIMVEIFPDDVVENNYGVVNVYTFTSGCLNDDNDYYCDECQVVNVLEIDENSLISSVLMGHNTNFIEDVSIITSDGKKVSEIGENTFYIVTLRLKNDKIIRKKIILNK